MRPSRTCAAGLSLLTAVLAGSLSAGQAVAASTAAGRAPVVRGAILAHWNALGGRAGLLGAPLTSEAPTRPRPGAFSTFAGGAIFWSPRTGAWETHGAVREKWLAQRAENGRLGFPTSDEQRTPGGTGVVGRFERGAVYWSAATGAHVVQGEVLAAYRHAGQDASLGLPTSDEVPLPDVHGAVSFFERGAVYWSRYTGAAVVRGALCGAWTRAGAEHSALGLPLEDEQRLRSGDVVQYFMGGALEYSAVHGVFVAEAFGEVAALDPARNTLVLDGLQALPATYRDQDDFYEVSADAVTYKPTRIDVARFEALAPAAVVLVQQDPAGTSAYTVITGLDHLFEATPGLRAAARAH